MHYGGACWQKLCLTVVLIKNENLPLGFCVSFILRCLFPRPGSFVLAAASRSPGQLGPLPVQHFASPLYKFGSWNKPNYSATFSSVCVYVWISLLHCLSFCRPRLAFCLLAKQPRPSGHRSSLNKLSNRNSCASLKVKNEAAKDEHCHSLVPCPLSLYKYIYIFCVVFWQPFALPD